MVKKKGYTHRIFFFFFSLSRFSQSLFGSVSKIYLEVYLQLFFKLFFVLKCIKMIFFYFLKIIFDIKII
jgi:hypothetical protein